MSTRTFALPLVAAGVTAALMIAATPFAFGSDDVPGPATHRIQYSPYPEKNFPNRVYFGDTHMHTSYSADAGMIGNTLGPDDASLPGRLTSSWSPITRRTSASLRC